jgi:hypothetical protein
VSQGDTVLKAGASLPADAAVQRTLQEAIEKLKILKELLPRDELEESGRAKSASQTRQMRGEMLPASRCGSARHGKRPSMHVAAHACPSPPTRRSPGAHRWVSSAILSIPLHSIPLSPLSFYLLLSRHSWRAALGVGCISDRITLWTGAVPRECSTHTFLLIARFPLLSFYSIRFSAARRDGENSCAVTNRAKSDPSVPPFPLRGGWGVCSGGVPVHPRMAQAAPADEPPRVLEKVPVTGFREHLI